MAEPTRVAETDERLSVRRLVRPTGTERCTVSYIENVLTADDAAATLRELRLAVPWETRADDFGPQSRPTAYFADSPDCVFTYVGLRLEPVPTTDTIARLRASVADACGLARDSLTACLANLYAEGEGHIPWHYDEVRAHGERKIVAALSLGGPRVFQYRRRSQERNSRCGATPDTARNADALDGRSETTEEPVVRSVVMEPGSVLLMMDDTQEHYEHRLPLAKDVQDHVYHSNDNDNDYDYDYDGECPIADDPLRISLTFRSIVPGYETERTSIATDACCVEAPGYSN